MKVLFISGVEDSVRCYYCGGGLRNWEPNDDPMSEHARWYPTCPHLKLTMGQEFINTISNDEEWMGTTTNGLNRVPGVQVTFC